MQYFRELLKNIDLLLLFILLAFAVISVVSIGSTAYNDGFVFTRAMKVQIFAFCLGLALLLLILFFDYKILDGLGKIIYVSSLLFLFSVFCSGFNCSEGRSMASNGHESWQSLHWMHFAGVMLMWYFEKRDVQLNNTPYGQRNRQ